MEPFDVIEPRAGETPVVVEVPHAGLWIDPETLAYTFAPARSIARDADLYVDDLFRDTVAEGATFLAARASRFVVDLNRGEGDVDGEAVEGAGQTPWPRGLVWRLTTDNDAILAAPLPRREVERRLEAVYRPYHRALQALLQRKLARFGHAVLLCAHSMPSTPRPAPQGRQPAPLPRADIVPGTRGRTSALAPIIDRVDAHARAFGFSVRHDDPYRGGYSTATYGRPAQGVHAVQIEIARRLYMNESSLRIDVQGFRIVREFARTLAARLAEPVYVGGDPQTPIADGAPRYGGASRAATEPFRSGSAEPRRSR